MLLPPLPGKAPERRSAVARTLEVLVRRMPAAGWALMAIAAESTAQALPETVMPQVVVTATRSERSAFEVPASIDSTPARALDRLNVNVSEALSAIPGVAARNRQNYAQDEQVSIRGFGARSTFGIRGVRLYTDGIPASAPDGQGQVSHFNLDSAERIEVLRGPFSALYGNSSGGVVQVFTADGSDPPELRAGAAVGSDGALRTGVNALGIKGALDYNLDFTHFQTDGWRDHSRAQRESANAKLRWRVGDDRELTLVANTVNVPGAQDPLGLTREQFDTDPRRVAAPAELFDTRKSVSQQQAGLIYEHAFGARQALRAMGYYGRREVLQFLSVPVAAQATPLSSGGVVDLGNDYGGADLRWIWRGALAGRPLELVAGLAFDAQRQHRRGYENFAGTWLGVRGALRRDAIDRVDSFDQYAQASWQAGEAWTLIAGLRRSEVDFESDDRYLRPGNPDDSGRARYSATSPVAGLLWRASERVRVYAAWGRGFETPTFSELSYRNDGGAGLNFGLQAARTRSMEAGLKLRPWAGAQMQLALFRADTRDELAIATNSGGRTTFQNIDRSRRQGLEAAFAADLGARWRLQLACTWLDAAFRAPFLTCVGAGCATPDTPVPAGTPIPGVARRSAFAALRFGGELGWRGGLEGRDVGALPANDLGTASAPSATLFALSTGYAAELGRWRLHAFARLDNVLDRRHVGSVIVNDGNGRYYEPGLDRSVLVGIEARWRR